MVAYSFQGRFVAPILARTKRQTIRNVGQRRHARPGETLQLYTGMRTRACTLQARATCVSVDRVLLSFASDRVTVGARNLLSSAEELDAFAIRDGFEDWADLKGYWRTLHPDVLETFSGVLVDWGETARPPATEE